MARTVSQTINLQAVPEAVSKYITRIDGGGISIHDTQRQNLDYIQLDSNGLKLYKDGGNYTTAEFGSTSYIGKRDGEHSYLKLDYHSLSLIDKEQNIFLHILDARENNGEAPVTEEFWEGGQNDTINLDYPLQYPVASVSSVSVNNTEVEQGTDYDIIDNTLHFYSLNNNDNIIINYTTTSILMKNYILGQPNDLLNRGSWGGYGLIQGYNTSAYGFASHAEGGILVTAIGDYSHAEGVTSRAEGYGSHAEGDSTQASGNFSHTEGNSTYASGNYSHALGGRTRATRLYQVALGESNREDEGGTDKTTRGDYVVIIGNGSGTSSSTRSNALTIDWQGRIECGDYSGTLTSIFDIFYPVGSYYDTSDSTFDPNTSLGGTWSSEEILDDEIVEEGTTDIWTYRKWKSGISECWGMHTFTLSIGNAYGNGPVYYGQYTSLFPSNLFISEPVVTATRQGRAGAGLIHISPYSVTATQASYFVANTSAVYNNAPIGVSFAVKGLWKTYSAPTTKYRWHRTA